ncbi:MAG: hypothetical protein IT226_05460 [Flavobacteriales bacterium]|nr:hypothetical protein [Flavobacteriales bacterium]
MKHAVSGTKRMRSTLSSLAAVLSALLPLALTAQTNGIRCESTSSVSPAILQAAQGYAGVRDATRYVKLKVIIASQTGPGGDASTPSIVQRDLDGMNELYSENNTGIQFDLCGPVQVVDNDNLYALWNLDPANLNPYYEPGYITLVYCALLPNGLAGFNMGDIVYLHGGGSIQVAAHEVGHALGLMHTHDSVFGAELVDGSNCGVAGDFICDTPADPNLSLPGMIAYANCTYIGTALDANGDAYQPITNNIMSYAPCALSTFTQGQAQVMQYVLDNVKTNLRVSYIPIAIAPFDTRQCHNTGSIALSATPGPGSFDGPLVSGTTLNNAPNTPGEYYVTYTPLTPPMDSSTYIDQAYTMYDRYLNYNYSYTVLDSLVQTLRAGADGRLAQVDFLLHDDLPNNFRLRVYNGVGVLLHESTLSVPAIVDTSWLSFPVADLVPITNEAMYALELVADHAFTQVTSFGANWAYYDYTRGSSNVDAYRDAAFRTWVHALPSCQSAIRYYELYQVPPHTMLNLADAYCASEVDTVWLIGDNSGSLDADIWIEGIHTSGFVPSALGEGTHTLQYINTVFGCTDTTVSIIAITLPAALSIPALNAPLCLSADPFVLQGDPFGGYITVDGVRDSLLNASALGVGPHMAQYTYEEVLDTVSFYDQASGLGGYSSGAQGTADVGIAMWQSFTPAFSGRLEHLIIGMYGNQGLFSYAVRLLHGTGPDGLLIGTDTITVVGSYPDMLGSIHPEVFRDSVYTIWMERVADALPTADQVYYFTDGTLYARGTGQYGTEADIDLYFQETVSHVYTCGDPIAVPFTVEACTGVQELAEGNLLIGPNPFTDAITLRARSDVRYVLYNAVGAELLSGTTRSGTLTTLPTAHLAAGLYTLRCTAMDGTGARTVAVVKAQ